MSLNSAFINTVCMDFNMKKSSKSNEEQKSKINNEKKLIHPYKDLRCSYKCYLNWVSFNMKPPVYHSCECTIKQNKVK